jgi:precorrin-6Y C5,15-methyltransferase (decarboxylating)
LQKTGKIYVIGIGFKPLDNKAKEIVKKSQAIVTSNRILELFKEYEEYDLVKDKTLSINNVSDIISFIREKLSNPEFGDIVFFGSGDPLFYGIGRKIIDEFGRESVEIIPEISSIQLAFARIKESWDNALLLSLHGTPDPTGQTNKISIEDLPTLLIKHSKVAMITDKQNNPGAIAKYLLNSLPERHASAFQISVCEQLGYPDEKITQGSLEEIAGMEFSDLNVVILQRHQDESFIETPIFGLKEDEIQHSRGLITKDEVRAITIHKLRLPEKGIFWDIGAGSGSISIEAARLSPKLSVYAIEKNETEIKNITENKSNFGVTNLRIIAGEAPDILESLPPPDRVFMGGSGGNLKEIIDFVRDRTSCEIVVLNAATLDTLSEGVAYLKESGFRIEVSQILVARSKAIGRKLHLSSQNPVFVIVGMR